MRAQMPHQGACVDLRDHRNLEALQILIGNLLRAPVRRDGRKLARHQPFDVGLVGFVVAVVGAVIPDLRIRQNDDLPRIGWIGENFLVAG